MANANIVNLTRGTGLNGNSLMTVLQDRNMSEQYKGTIYTHLWVAFTHILGCHLHIFRSVIYTYLEVPFTNI
jgi:hypothetical protein